MQFHLEGLNRPTAPGRANHGPVCLPRVRSSACEELVLVGPVQRQIEFVQTRRSERDGVPAFQDRVDEPQA